MADLLIVDDQDRYFELCREAIPEHRYRGPARNAAEALQELARARGRVDGVLLDVHFAIEPEHLLGYAAGMKPAAVERLRRRQGLLILAELRRKHPDLPVIVMTSREELSLESELPMEEDFTYFLDDEYVDARALQGQIQRVVSERRAEDATGPVYWGPSRTLRRIRHRLSILARGRLPVVLLGPMGTGKSLLARHYIHEHSGRTGRFVSVDLSTVPADLMAAHLFGAVRGAYTGSVADRLGAFEAADRGTLFLDEVGNLSLAAQKMLLAVLQEGRVSRVGDLKERPVDVKLVVATNEDLRAKIRDGSFRADLFMRLNPAAAIELPPLVDRGVDWSDLVDFCLRQSVGRPFLRELIDEYREQTGLKRGRIRVVVGSSPPRTETGTLVLFVPERSLRLLKQHAWPGNLREFAMTVENAVLFALAEMSAAAGGDRADVITVGAKTVRDLLVAGSLEPAVTTSGTEIAVDVRSADTLNKVSVGVERQYFEALFRRAEGDFGQMASWLLDDPTAGRKVQLRLNQLGLKVRELKERLR